MACLVKNFMKTVFWPDKLSTAVRTYTYMRINCLSFSSIPLLVTLWLCYIYRLNSNKIMVKVKILS